MELDKTENIPEFFSSRTIFITGGTGFIGKVLIEKLLRSCPDLHKIYVLVRSKKGTDANQRMKKVLEDPLFEPLRSEQPQQFHKIEVVRGDVEELGVGLSEEDKKKIVEEVSVVFHSAASVRFDDPLKKAVIMNTRGTLQMVNLSRDMSQLAAFVLVSTTYCNTDRPVSEERVYPIDQDWKKMIKICETMDENTINVFEQKIIGCFPNTYIYTKRLSEQLLAEHSHLIPCAIFRPSIVVSTYEEPLEGWIDNFNGPVALFVGGGKGITRIIPGAPDIKADFIPADSAIKALIACAWDTAVNRHRLRSAGESHLPVYNCCTSQKEYCPTQQSIMDISLPMCRTLYPLNDCIWYPNCSYTTSRVYYFINLVLFQLIPALMIDSLLVLSNKKPRLMRIQRKMFVACEALHDFLFNEWHFKSDRFIQLEDRILTQDKPHFHFRDSYRDPEVYLTRCIKGSRPYLLKETPASYQPNLKHLYRLYWIDRAAKVLFLILLTTLIIKFNVVQSAVDQLLRILG